MSRVEPNRPELIETRLLVVAEMLERAVVELTEVTDRLRAEREAEQRRELGQEGDTPDG